MTHAYNKTYLKSAQNNLAEFLDYLINDIHFSSAWVSSLFLVTGVAKQFESGNPAYVVGMSGVELARFVIKKAYNKDEDKKHTRRDILSSEYWTGWALAYYQWFSCRRFKDIFERIPLEKIIQMYSVYHEMDISSFCESMELMYKNSGSGSKLKKMRENRGLSQKELAKIADVKLRTIQAYEQKTNDIDKAQVNILYKLTRVLCCDIEDILENPME